MAIIFTKLTSKVKANLRIFKFAYQFWLEENSSEACVNITLCLINLSEDTSATGFSVYFPFEVDDVMTNSYTLLDKSSPLNKTRGGYRYPKDETDILPILDGVPNVRVDLLHELNLSSHTSETLCISQVDVIFKKDIKAGEKVGLRIVFKTKDVITNIDENSISFLCKIFDMYKYDKYISDNDLEAREIKVQCYYDWDAKSGGFDPIIFYPQKYEMGEVKSEYDSVIDREDLNYNYLGETVNKRYKKATWRAWKILHCTKNKGIVGYRDYIQWCCIFQNSKALGNTIVSLREEIEQLAVELTKQTKRSKLFGLLTIILGLVSIVLVVILALI